MDISYYIAQRISKSSTTGHSGTIIKIAIFSISLSMAIMLLSTAVLLGFREGISEKVFGFWGHIHITDTRMSRSFEISPVTNDQALKDSILSIEKLYYVAVSGNSAHMDERETSGGVYDVVPYIIVPAIVNSKEDAMEALLLKGVNEDYNWERFGQYLKEGTFPKIEKGTASREIMLSEQTSKRMNVNVGDKVLIYFLKDQEPVKRRFKVSGLYKTGLEEYDKKVGFIDMSVIQQVLEWEEEKVAGFEVFIDDIDDVIPIADYIYEEVLPPNLYAETIKEKFASMFDWVKMQDINGILLLFLMTLVALINMSTALLIFILERSTMIGILKSVGISNWSLRKVFIYVSAWISILSLIIGNVFGLGLGFLQQKTGLIKLNEANYYLSEVPIRFDLMAILGINFATLVITILVMVIPTFLVTRIKPVDILRFQ